MINTSLLTSEDNYVIGDRKLGALRDVFFPGDREEVGAKYQVKAWNLDQFGGYGYKYADFTDIWDEWQDKLTWDYQNPLISKVPTRFADGDYGRVERAISGGGRNTTIYIPGSDGIINTHMDAMIFLQMSSTFEKSCSDESTSKWLFDLKFLKPNSYNFGIQLKKNHII